MKNFNINTMMLLVITCLAVIAGRAQAQDATAPPVMPETPTDIVKLVHAVPFTLETGEKFLWRADQPIMTEGWLLVLKVDSNLVAARQSAEPVLYVGNTTAERFNHGYESGHVVAFVPANLDNPKAEDFIDLTTDRIWFGTPELPERVTADIIDHEKFLADREGIKAHARGEIIAAVEEGGDRLELENKLELIQEAVELVRRYSPQEKTLIDTHKGAADEVVVTEHNNAVKGR